MSDKFLEEWLSSVEIDRILCWLIGSHGARMFNKVVNEKGINTPGEYRIIVQNEVYELADRVLKKDGLLHIVDRVKYPETDLERKYFRESHEDQASVTSLIIGDIEFKNILMMSIMELK